MQRTLVTINTEQFFLSPEQDSDALRGAIVGAAQAGAGFVDLVIAGDGVKSVLVTDSSTVSFETVEIVDADHPADVHPVDTDLFWPET